MKVPFESIREHCMWIGQKFSRASIFCFCVPSYCPPTHLFLSFYDLNFNPWSSRVSQETKWSQLDALYIVIVVMLWASAFMKIQHSSTKSCSATLSGPSNACLALKDGRETSLGPLTVQKNNILAAKDDPSGSNWWPKQKEQRCNSMQGAA